MRLYDDYYKNSYDELITFYPDYYANIVEMNEILKTEGRLLDDAKNSIETVFKNCFIESMDEATIRKLEKILHIPLQKISLEERRKIVKLYFLGSGKVSASNLKAMIKNYTGGNVECELLPADQFGNNMLFIYADRGNAGNFDMNIIEDFLLRRLPAHINYEFSVCEEFPIYITFEIEVYENSYPKCGSLLCGQYPLGGG